MLQIYVINIIILLLKEKFFNLCFTFRLKTNKKTFCKNSCKRFLGCPMGLEPTTFRTTI